MANLKRNMIELIKNIDEVEKGGEPVMEKFWTPLFIPFSKVRDALQMQMEIENNKKLTELDTMDKLSEFVAKDIYNNQFTKEDLYTRLHAPDAVNALQSQLMFVAQGDQTDETKKFLAKKG